MSDSSRQMVPAQPRKSAAVARRDAVQGIVDGIMPRIRNLKTVSPERFAQIVLVEASRNPKLAECTRDTLGASLMLCAELGLEPSGPRGHAYLIPRNTKVKTQGAPDRWEMQCTLMLGYKGLAELARRSGQIRRLNAQPVYRGEVDRGLWTASLEPTEIIHRYDLDVDRSDGELVAVYAVAETTDGSKSQVILTRQQIDARRARGKDDGFSPWKSDYAAMARKTALRALLTGGLVPLSERAAVAIDQDDPIDTTAEPVSIGEPPAQLPPALDVPVEIMPLERTADGEWMDSQTGEIMEDEPGSRG
uniref:Putative DNA recombination protein n=1 Tax=viral metagenome TaxID=1070528 RepID=A0A6M3KT12_9ZZZZ